MDAVAVPDLQYGLQEATGLCSVARVQLEPPKDAPAADIQDFSAPSSQPGQEPADGMRMRETEALHAAHVRFVSHPMFVPMFWA